MYTKLVQNVIISWMIQEFLKTNKSRIIRLFLLAFWIIFLFTLILSFTKPLYQDEGVFLAIAKGIAGGKLPYLAFWDHKTPGIYLTWGLLYPLLGTKIILYKIFIWVINFLTAGFVYKISERYRESSGKYSAPLFLASLIFFEGNYLVAEPFVAFSLASALFLILKPSQHRSWYFVAGLTMFFAVLFKQTAAVSLIPLVVYVYIYKKDGLWPLFVGLLTPTLIFISYLLGTHSFTAFWQQAFVANVAAYPSEPFRKVILAWFDVFRRVWWLILGLMAFFIGNIKFDSKTWLLISLSLLPVITFFVRPYPHYWIQVLPFMAILAGIGFLRLQEYLFPNNVYILPIIFVVIIASFGQNALWYRWITANLNAPKDTEQTQATEIINKLSSPTILTENRYTGFFFLSNKSPLTKYIYLTEVNEGEHARQQTLETLQNTHNVVILWPSDERYVYAKEIGSWVRNNCRNIATFPALDMTIYQKD